MKKQLFIFLVVVLSSCATVRESSLPEDELFLTRKYVGNFIEYRHTEPERLGDPHLIWIKTTQDTIYNKISAYSKDCQFNVNDRLYIRRIYYSPGITNHYWMYQIESDKLLYRLSKFQFDNKILVQTWF
ncbi:MAG TPA: hypothetical protein VMV77_03490 [Bacteroidales bacterium]|nr:hypothetical protein [Bacteroidales bacterium]